MNLTYCFLLYVFLGYLYTINIKILINYFQFYMPKFIELILQNIYSVIVGYRSYDSRILIVRNNFQKFICYIKYKIIFETFSNLSLPMALVRVYKFILKYITF